MHTITTLKTRNLAQSQKDGGCFECRTSCQSACKTSCGVANQKCEASHNGSKTTVIAGKPALNLIQGL